jgi:hypothetical protein
LVGAVGKSIGFMPDGESSLHDKTNKKTAKRGKIINNRIICSLCQTGMKTKNK